MNTISKKFEFSFNFAHRTWSNELVEEFSLTNKNKENFIHGHTATVKVSFFSDNVIDETTNFDYLGNFDFFKKILEEVFDHKFILHYYDPILQSLLYSLTYNTVNLADIDKKFINLNAQVLFPIGESDKDEEQCLSSFVLLPFQPTPQNMAKLFCDFIYNTFKNNLSFQIVNWIRVDFYDTPVSKSTFTKHIN